MINRSGSGYAYPGSILPDLSKWMRGAGEAPRIWYRGILTRVVTYIDAGIFIVEVNGNELHRGTDPDAAREAVWAEFRPPYPGVLLDFAGLIQPDPPKPKVVWEEVESEARERAGLEPAPLADIYE